MPITSDLTPLPEFTSDENLNRLTEALAPFGFTAGSGKAAEPGLSFRVSVREAGEPRPPELKARGLFSSGKRNPARHPTTPGFSFSSLRREPLKSRKGRRSSW